MDNAATSGRRGAGDPPVWVEEQPRELGTRGAQNPGSSEPGELRSQHLQDRGTQTPSQVEVSQEGLFQGLGVGSPVTKKSDGKQKRNACVQLPCYRLEHAVAPWSRRAHAQPRSAPRCPLAFRSGFRYPQCHCRQELGKAICSDRAEHGSDGSSTTVGREKVITQGERKKRGEKGVGEYYRGFAHLGHR